jgi:hypothetical protein
LDGERAKRVAEVAEDEWVQLAPQLAETSRPERVVEALTQRAVVERLPNRRGEDEIPVAGEMLAAAQAVERGSGLIDQRHRAHLARLWRSWLSMRVTPTNMDQALGKVDVAPPQRPKLS